MTANVTGVFWIGSIMYLVKLFCLYLKYKNYDRNNKLGIPYVNHFTKKRS
jgi:hypothetical protein